MRSSFPNSHSLIHPPRHYSPGSDDGGLIRSSPGLPPPRSWTRPNAARLFARLSPILFHSFSRLTHWFILPPSFSHSVPRYQIFSKPLSFASPQCLLIHYPLTPIWPTTPPSSVHALPPQLRSPPLHSRRLLKLLSHFSATNHTLPPSSSRGTHHAMRV